MSNIPIISFFTGGGFLDLGFEMAGFDVRWTNECNPDFGRIYASGITSWRKSSNKKALAAAITNSSKIEELQAHQVLKDLFLGERPDIFGVIGGPPCTDFSVGGVHAGHSGDAGKLTAVYVKMLRNLNPDFFLLENVPHLESHPKHGLRFRGLLASLQSSGYSVIFDKLNALEYGVPQDRVRLFVLGFKNDLLRQWSPEGYFPKKTLERYFKWPLKTHANAKFLHDWPSTGAFGGSPVEPSGIPLELCVYTSVSKKPDPETLTNGKDFFNPYSEKFGLIKEGDVSGKSFKRLHRYRYSPTAWYGNNEVHLHPWKKRRLSVREALRIQTVPDTYVMPDDVPLCSKFKVIGNGVPCLLAKKLAVAISEFIVRGENGELHPNEFVTNERSSSANTRQIKSAANA